VTAQAPTITAYASTTTLKFRANGTRVVIAYTQDDTSPIPQHIELRIAGQVITPDEWPGWAGELIHDNVPVWWQA